MHGCADGYSGDIKLHDSAARLMLEMADACSRDEAPFFIAILPGQAPGLNVQKAFICSRRMAEVHRLRLHLPVTPIHFV